MSYHISNMGRFGGPVQPFADLDGYVPEPGDQWNDFHWDAAEDEPTEEGWAEFVAEAEESTAAANRSASEWRDGRHYIEALQDDPIPAWALQAALSHLIESGAIEANGKGQTWLANQLGRTPRSVRMWIDGSRNCSGLTADVVRRVIEEVMEG